MIGGEASINQILFVPNQSSRFISEMADYITSLFGCHFNLNQTNYRLFGRSTNKSLEKAKRKGINIYHKQSE